MQQLANAIQAHLDTLVDQYDARLQTMPGYVNFPAAARRDLERQMLNLIARCLIAGDSHELVEYSRQRAIQWAGLGLDLAWFQQALVVPEEILVPLINSVEASTFLWQALNRSQAAVWQLVAERARSSEEKLRAIYEGTNDAVMLLNEQGFFDCNPRTLDMFGFKTREEFTAVHPADVSPQYQPDGQESLPAAQVHIQTAYQQGYDRFEWIHRRTNGEDFSAEVLLSAFDFGGQRVLQATVRDITKRKHIEQRLNESEERYRRFSDAAVEGIVIHDKGILLDANEVFARMFGYDLSEVIGMAATEFLTPETREITVQNIRSGYEKPYEVMGLRQDGSTFPVEITGKAIPYEGQTLRVSALRDITERKQAEEQIERNLQETRVRLEVSQALAGQKTEDEVLVTLARQAGLYPQALVTFATFDRSGDETVAVARYAESFESGMSPTLPMGTRFPFSQFPLFRLLSADRPFVSQDTQADDRMDAASRQITRETGAAGFAVFPLTTNNEWLGYMMVFARTAGFFDEGKQRLYQTMVDQGALALQTARLRDHIQASLEQRGRQVQTSTEVAQEITSATDLTELFKRVVTLIKERFNYYHAQIFRYEADQDAVVLLTGYGEARARRCRISCRDRPFAPGSRRKTRQRLAA